MFRSLIAFPLLALAGGAAFAQTPQREIGKPASIPFVDMRGIEDFQPDGEIRRRHAEHDPEQQRHQNLYEK